MCEIMKEIWKDIPEYEGRYKVSNLGRVMSLDWMHTKQERIMKESFCTNGYVKVSLFKNKTSKQCMVHRLVAKTFIPNPNNYPCINHKNENKADNRVENLEWCTYSYNNTYNNKPIRAKETKRKHNCKYAGIPVLQLSLDGKVIRRFESAYGAQRATGIRHIYESCQNQNRYKTVGGYRWVFADRFMG